jgi:two-component system, cell cycle sensor histidine kinase and response regulator CckA
VTGFPAGHDGAESITGALHELERRRELLFGPSPDPVFAFDLTGRLASGNAALGRLTGVPARDLLGRSFLAFVAPDARHRALRHFRRAVRGEAQRFDMTAVAADGRECLLDTRFIPTVVAGAVQGVHGTARDVTRERDNDRALRELQERYNLLAEHALDMISLHDTAGRFLYASPSAGTLLGYHPVELVGQSVYEVIESEDVPALRAAHEAIMAREGRGPAVFRAQRRDGSTGWFETTARMVTHPETGEPWRIVGVTRDITERRAVEQHLMQAQKMEALGRLADGIAHDFNNVLTVIGGHAELLSHRLGDAPERKSAEHIREAAVRAASLTTQLMSFGRGAPQQLRLLDPNELLLELQPLLVRVLGGRATLSLELAPGLLGIRADLASLRQVLVNLMTNAREAISGEGPEGHVRVTTRNRRLEQGEDPVLPAGEYVDITVRDDGRGMTPDVALRIFEPFFTTKRSGGAGLGLSTAYSDVRSAGGDISVETAPGRGAAFTLLYPAVGVPAPGTANERVITGQLAGTETILVAEDDPGVRSLVVATLERHGYSVVAAADGRQALDLYRTHAPAIDMIVTDVNMPAMTGTELARSVSAAGESLPILFISGFTADAFPFIEAEQRMFLAKPFTPVQLAQAVAHALAGSRR